MNIMNVLNEIFFRCILMHYASTYVFIFNAFMFMFMGYIPGDDGREVESRPLSGWEGRGHDKGFKKNMKSKKDFSSYECFTCHKMGHISINCPTRAEQLKKKNKIFQAHTTEDNDQEEEERTKEDKDSCEEYVLISALTGSVSPGNDTCLVDSGASRHMTGYKDSLSSLEQKDSPHKVMLGDDYQYAIKCMGEASYKLDSGNSMIMKDALYVPAIKKNLLSIS